MKLKNIIKIGSFVVAGVAPMTSSTASASDYMCLACPAGTYSNGGSTSCTECPAGKYAPAASTECKTCPAGTYSTVKSGSCLTCPDGYFPDGSKTQCLDVSLSCMWVNNVKLKPGNCQNVTLYPGRLYFVYLKGGRADNVYDYDENWQYGNDGASLGYQFSVKEQISAQICAADIPYGDSDGNPSYIKIGGKYIVAGGGSVTYALGSNMRNINNFNASSLFVGAINSGNLADRTSHANYNLLNYSCSDLGKRYAGGSCAILATFSTTSGGNCK